MNTAYTHHSGVATVHVNVTGFDNFSHFDMPHASNTSIVQWYVQSELDIACQRKNHFCSDKNEDFGP